MGKKVKMTFVNKEKWYESDLENSLYQKDFQNFQAKKMSVVLKTVKNPNSIETKDY